MTLLDKSLKLKKLISTFDTRWFLGDLSSLMHSITANRAQDQLGKLSSPQRQLYYLAGLLMTSPSDEASDYIYKKEKWDDIVELLNDIEKEYDELFFPKEGEIVDTEWKHIRQVAVPTFLSYFNTGPLNYEEQKINWIRELYSPMNTEISKITGISVEELIEFYNNIDSLTQKNFQGHTNNKKPLRENWKDYTNIKMGIHPDTPAELKSLEKVYERLNYFRADRGIKDRFYPEEIVSVLLPLEKVQIILKYLVCRRTETEFIYYTDTRSSNPLYERPIVDIGNGVFQVFEVKQVIHAIENFLEKVVLKNPKSKDKYIKRKGNLLENCVASLFKKFFDYACKKNTYKIYQGYFVDKAEQDILLLWNNIAFIIETKDYAYREPLRDPSKAYQRVKDSFNNCIGEAYKQARRIEGKFLNKEILVITNKKGDIIEQIDTSKFSFDFSIIVNKTSFGQIQCDLSTLLPVGNNDVYPWAVKLDDLEVFILTMIQKYKKLKDFVEFLLLREELHGRVICADELEICGAFLSKQIKSSQLINDRVFVTNPNMTQIFDDQYRKGLGLKDEKYWQEKKSGNTIFF